MLIETPVISFAMRLLFLLFRSKMESSSLTYEDGQLMNKINAKDVTNISFVDECEICLVHEGR